MNLGKSVNLGEDVKLAEILIRNPQVNYLSVKSDGFGMELLDENNEQIFESCFYCC
jgi:hypothetical protein